MSITSQNQMHSYASDFVSIWTSSAYQLQNDSDYNFIFITLVSAFGMLYSYLLLNLSASLITSRERQQVALIIVVCSQEYFDTIRIVICLLELSVASNLLGMCVHTLLTCFHWYVVLVFTVELVRIFVTINRATSGSLHCCLLHEKSVSISSSSIEGQVSFIIAVCRWKNWYLWYRHSLVGTTVRCLKPDQHVCMCTVDLCTLQE